MAAFSPPAPAEPGLVDSPAVPIHMPVTPTKEAAIDVDFHIDSLNYEFALGIVAVDSILSPKQQRELANTEEKKQVLKIHSHMRRVYWLYRAHHQDYLTKAVNEFREAAHRLIAKRIPNPQTSAATALPSRARNDTERKELQQLLYDILKSYPVHLSDANECDQSENSSTLQSTPPSAGLTATEAGISDQADWVPALRRSFGTPTPNSRHSVGTDSTVPSASFRPSLETSRNSSNESLALTVFSPSPADNERDFGTPSTASFGSPSHGDKAFRLSPQSLHQSISRTDTQESFFASLQTESSPFDHDDASSEYSGSSVFSDFPKSSWDTEPPIPSLAKSAKSFDSEFWNSLDGLWAKLPACLEGAPFSIIWEVTRAALHCKVDLACFDQPYTDEWRDQNTLRSALEAHPLFLSHTLPEKCPDAAWAAGLGSFCDTESGQSISLCADIAFLNSPKCPPWRLTLQPLKLSTGGTHRLGRRFGADRFLEITMPLLSSVETPGQMEEHAETIVEYLSKPCHSFLGRKWAAFWVETIATRRGMPSRTSPPSSGRARGPKKRHLHHIMLFAVDGNGFSSATDEYSPISETSDINGRSKMSREKLIEWAISPMANRTQTALKLFSRIKLSLSLTFATAILEPHQIRRREDITSDTNPGAVMNDGIGRISSGLQKRVTDRLSLRDNPSAFQARIGGAKGVWVVDDSARDDDEVWIEIYKSQLKWECHQSDPKHRTFEVKGYPPKPVSAKLNTQFIPLLEDRAKDRQKMRETIAGHLRTSIRNSLAGQVSVLDNPIRYRDSLRSSSTPSERIRYGYVPFLAGLPRKDEDIINFLLDGGFKPREEQFLKTIIMRLMKARGEDLKERLSIEIPHSTYLYMVVDFSGRLNEGEVHVGFSSKFSDGETGTLLHGVELLVARTPAHFISDVQKVRAVFHPELKHHKDVIVFSSKGNGPLAEKLSGGDYDGDKAWVCWDSEIVSNFQNAEKPPTPDLAELGYISKDKTTFAELISKNNNLPDDDRVAETISDFVHFCFRFNMQPHMLGICTNYKKQLNYKNNSVSDDASIFLSELVGNLVDQDKQGIIFGREDWERMRKEQKFATEELDDPPYEKRSAPTSKLSERHILDYLYFQVAETEVEKLLKALSKRFDEADKRMYWDEELAKPFKRLKELAGKENCWKTIMHTLKEELDDVAESWARSGRTTAGIQDIYQKWCEIRPAKVENTSLTDLLEESIAPWLSQWNIFKASVTFKRFHRKKPVFAWRMAGIQLQHIKAMQASSACDGAPAVTVTPKMYVVLQPHKKAVARLYAREGLAGYASSTARSTEEDYDEVQDGYHDTSDLE